MSETCDLCQKPFYSESLYSGKCKECLFESFDNICGQPGDKIKCLGCLKEYTRRTLEKRDGVCGHCFNSGKGPRRYEYNTPPISDDENDDNDDENVDNGI